jgi:hypothetical protein
MTDVWERKICIKFCSKLGKTAVETCKTLKEAFDDNTLGLIQTYDYFYELYKCFNKGQVSVDIDEHSGRPSTGAMTKMWPKCDRLSRKTEGK